MTTTTHRGTWTPRLRAEQFYRYLPFDVPVGAAGLRVQLEYDRSAGVIDLGCEGPQGFRGWSGGARSQYLIAESTATPGYLPGELEPGQWQVMLGLHRVPADLPYTVRAEILRTIPDSPAESSPPRPQRPPARRLPAPAGRRWLAGDFHSHSHHSDGSLSVAELAAGAAAAGLDVLAITDHNTISHHRSLGAASADSGVLLLPGQEITTERGHANAFGDIGWIDFRRPAAEWASEVERRGGLLSINHPIAVDCAWRQALPQPPPLAEIWHCTWRDRTWSGPLAWWLAWGSGVSAIGGSDFHAPGRDRPLAEPTTWIAVPDDTEVTVEKVLGALRDGQTAISATRDGPVLVPVDDELLAVDADGAILSDFSGRRRLVRGDRHSFPRDQGPHWLEDSTTAVLALCG